VKESPLDYALLELIDPVARPIPRLAPSVVQLDSISRMAANIVQHPRGSTSKSHSETTW
jgi:hypothetical protein